MKELLSYKAKISEGKNENGSYTDYEHRYEVLCNCNKDKCSHFNKKVWKTEKYRQYENNIKQYI